MSLARPGKDFNVDRRQRKDPAKEDRGSAPSADAPPVMLPPVTSRWPGVRRPGILDWSMRLPSATLLAALLASSASVRAAETTGVLAVAPPPGPSPELVEITTQLRNALAERTPDVLDPHQLRERIPNRPRAPPLLARAKRRGASHSTRGAAQQPLRIDPLFRGLRVFGICSHHATFALPLEGMTMTVRDGANGTQDPEV